MKSKITIDELFEKVWREHWSTERFIRSGWGIEAKRSYLRHIQQPFGAKKVSALTANQVRTWHKGLAATPIAANRALAVLSKMFSFAEEKEWRPQGMNPCLIVTSFREKKRKRFATPDEIKKIGEILKREESKYPREVAFIYLLMFSGARPRAIERALYNDIRKVCTGGQTFGVITSHGKTTNETGEDEIIVIAPHVLDLISRCYLGNDKGTLTGIKMPKKFWARVRKEAGCEDLWARDWRRTFATVGLSNGISSGVIGELLNHKSAETTKIYARLLDDKRIQGVKEISDRLSLLLKGDV